MEIVRVDQEVFEATQCRLETLLARDLPGWTVFASGELDLRPAQVEFAAHVAEKLKSIADDLAVLNLVEGSSPNPEG